ncbi:putative crotonobetaine/carnitine-CoA ligase [Pandoraea soli]|uniref:Crotonobetaine/carnitine-CoA ligase n=2 Tax=Pandoraea soli TaxID=2508293 RepID=A0ABY6VLI8_9BURK|nr:putative crotonobetaine/carnitine-CoA ligase [Pandoraea soli]
MSMSNVARVAPVNAQTFSSMHPYTKYFPQRAEGDRLDVVPLLMAGLHATSAKPVVVFEGEAIDRAQMAARVGAMQGWLAAQGLVPGDRVAVMLGNSSAQVALIYALMLSGLVWVPVNTRLKGDGIEYLLGHAKPTLLIAEPAFADVLDAGATLAAQQPGHHGTRVVRHWLAEVMTQAAAYTGTAPAAAELAPASVLCIIYTSGTTGAPKGVLFTHRMMRIASEAALRVANAHDGDRLFLWEPLCHIGGAQMLLLPFLADVEMHVVERFSASRFWQQCATAQATHLHYLGGILDILMQLPRDAQPVRNSLRVAWGAGVSASAWQATRERLQCTLRECYGMTECSSFATLNDAQVPGSIGHALPWLTLELLDDAGQPVPDGEPGEIVLSSEVEGVFLPGYLDNPEATSKALRDGKLFTGDSARRSDDGSLVFIGRRTDSMRVRGENVSAWEIERVFARHPAVAACAAIGVASDIGEQDVMLYVQFRDGQTLDWTVLAQWAADKLASYQRPRYYRATERFETTPSERIRKHLLSRDTSQAWELTAAT